jgi:hypothetical protein
MCPMCRLCASTPPQTPRKLLPPARRRPHDDFFPHCNLLLFLLLSLSRMMGAAAHRRWSAAAWSRSCSKAPCPFKRAQCRSLHSLLDFD